MENSTLHFSIIPFWFIRISPAGHPPLRDEAVNAAVLYTAAGRLRSTMPLEIA